MLRAFIALSPAPARQRNRSLGEQFGPIVQPMLCITGTLDASPLQAMARRIGQASRLGEIDAADRASVYEGLPPGQRALLVLDEADHATFSGSEAREGTAPAGTSDGRRDRGPGRHAGTERLRATLAAQPRHHALVAAVSSDWWRSRLLGDGAANERLAAPAGLIAQDVWRQG
jgi:hypothetical protein